MLTNIFVLDDNPHIVKLITKNLENIGQDVKGFTSGADVKKEIENGHFPCVLITDIMMPNMDGLEVMKYFSEKSPNTKLIVYSAIDSFYDMKSANYWGCKHYISKDAGVDVLLNKVDDLLQNKDEGKESQLTVFIPKESLPISKFEVKENIVKISCSEELPLGSIITVDHTDGKQYVLMIKGRKGEFGKYSYFTEEVVRSS